MVSSQLKNTSSNRIISPNRGENKKYIWNHLLVTVCNRQEAEPQMISTPMHYDHLSHTIYEFKVNVAKYIQYTSPMDPMGLCPFPLFLSADLILQCLLHLTQSARTIGHVTSGTLWWDDSTPSKRGLLENWAGRRTLSSWWFQPIWKISAKLDHLPR